MLIKNKTHKNSNKTQTVKKQFSQKNKRKTLKKSEDLFICGRNSVKEALNENQIKRIASLLNSGKRVVMAGSEAESSILEDFKLKFLGLGVDISTVTQNKFLEPRVSALGQGSIIIIFNLSEETEDVRATVRKAKFKGAYLVLITADERQGELYDEVIMTNCTKGMSNMVSRQMVILIIMDVIYTYCSANHLYFETIKDERKEFSSNE